MFKLIAFLSAFSILAPVADAGTIETALNSTVSQSGDLIPGGAGQLFSAWEILAPNAESLRVLSLTILFQTTGTVAVQNLRLMSGANYLYAGSVIVNPTMNDTFYFDIAIPANAHGDLRLFGDIFSGGNGAIKVSVLPGGLTGVGLDSQDAYTGPAVRVDGNTRIVGNGEDPTNPPVSTVPEPGTLALALSGITICLLRRRR